MLFYCVISRLAPMAAEGTLYDRGVGQTIYENGEYAERNEGWHDDDAPWKAANIARLLGRQASVPTTICDIGCGTGGVVDALGPLLPNAKIVGFDISPQAVELASARHPTADIRLGDANDIGGTFDLVMLIDVFEHVDDYIGFIKKAGALGDRLLCHIPLDMSVSSVARTSAIRSAREVIGHLHYFSKESALATLEYAGFRLEDWSYTATALELPNPSRSRVARIPRKLAYAFSPDLAARVLGGFSMLTLSRRVLPAPLSVDS